MIRITTTAALALTLAACAPPAEEPAPKESTPAVQTGSDPSAAATAAAGTAPQVRIFRDWMAACDNAGRCIALTGMAGEGGWLKIGIEAGPGAQPVVSFGAVDFQTGEPAANARLTVDGQAVALDPSAVAALAQGRRAAVTASGRVRPVSLSGAAAALLWIDERQGRLDTPTALVRRGDRPAGTVPEGPTRPRVKALPVPGGGAGEERPVPTALEALDAVKECRVDVPDGQARTWRIGMEDLLWEVPCYRGAYNAGSRLFIADPEGRDAHALGLPVARGEPTPFIVNGDFDPETGLLTSFDKGRGVGDCGYARTWVWTGRGFVLVREAGMEECWGLPADQWPVLYEAVVE